MSIGSIFGKIYAWLKSDSAKNVVATITRISEEAVPVIEAISRMTPTRRDDEIVGAYLHYGEPLLVQLNNGPVAARNALLELATQVLAKQFPGAATYMIQNAVTTAVTKTRLDATEALK